MDYTDGLQGGVLPLGLASDWQWTSRRSIIMVS